MTRFTQQKPRSFASRLKWHTEIFGGYFLQFMKMRLAYRMDFFVDTLAISFSLFIQLAVLSTLFSKVESLDGWSFHQVLFIYGFSLLPLGIFNILSINLYGFAQKYLIEGKFDRILLRPVNPLAQVLCESFNVSGLNEIILGSAITIYAVRELGLVLGVLDFIVLLIMIPSAALVYLGVFLAISAVSFWLEDKMGLSPPVYNLIRFSRYPVTIYGTAVRLFLTFVIPFAWVAFYPAAWFIGSDQFGRLALLTPVVGIVVFTGAVIVWNRGMKNYSSTGS
jgi:ABC-2 type transport system permease protein